MKNSPHLRVKLPGLSAQEKTHFLSLEQSQQKDERNKGKEKTFSSNPGEKPELSAAWVEETLVSFCRSLTPLR